MASDRSSQRRLQALTIVQKQQIVDEYTRRLLAGEDRHQLALAYWASKQFRLLRVPHQSTISRILMHARRRTLLPKQVNVRITNAKCRPLEDALHSWVKAQFSGRRFVNGVLIKEAGRRILSKMNENLPVDANVNLSFSNGWLYNFQRRYGLRALNSHGESGDANDSAIAREIAHLHNVIKQYKPEDVFNCDEFGHFYKMAPTKTIAHAPLPGRKKEKTRLTYLSCTNADGTEKLPLFIIGKAKRPRCFRTHTGQELGYDYANNKKAWMTASLFNDWVLRFSSYITRTDPLRRVLLLMDNCSAHGSTESLPTTDNVDVMFLPPNTTSKLQPLDAGIIAAVKARYRTRRYERVFDILDAGGENIYAIDKLTAMKDMTDIWETLSPITIANCWKHTGLMEGAKQVDSGCEQQIQDLREVVGTVVPECARDRISIASLINPESEDDVFEDVDEESLAVNAAEQMEIGYEEDEESENCFFLDSVSMEERLRSVVIAKHLLIDNGDAGGAEEALKLVLAGINCLHRKLRLERIGRAR